MFLGRDFELDKIRSHFHSAEYNLEKLLKKWNLVCMRVPLDHFDADTPSIGGSNLPGVHQIEMLVMTVDPTQEEPKPPKKDTIRSVDLC